MRKLFLLSESDTTIINQSLQSLHQQHPDLVVLSPDINIYSAKPLHHAKGLLGHTLNIIVLDCRTGFSLDYFLCAANTIQNNGMCIIIWQKNINDEQSKRFHTTSIPTDNFQDFLAEGLAKYSEPFPDNCNALHFTFSLHNDTPLNKEQLLVLNALNTTSNGIFTLFADRGTGKSFVIAEFIKSLKNDYIITAPNQTALQSYKDIQLNFMAPDYLFLNNNEIKQKWLIVEEAAQMPIAHLEKLSKLAKNVIIISSIENYEGTGKGLENKLSDMIAINVALTLTQHHRFASDDSLALFCDYISLQDSLLVDLADGMSLYTHQSLYKFQSNHALIKAFYQFMNIYHYQTNAQDIRRLFDSPNQSFIITIKDNKIISGLWAIEEGLLSQDLALDVFNGYRRPKGNLVVQTLAAHSYYPELMTLKSLRISRIAVDVSYRNQGIAKDMLVNLIEYAKENNYDFLSTSFGLTEPLLQFWQQCGFTWIHMGSHRDKTTGLHAAILIFPISQEMKKKTILMQKKWQSDAFLLTSAPFVHPNIIELLDKQGIEDCYDQLDEMVIQAYSHHKKSKEAVFSALKRQYIQNKD